MSSNILNDISYLILCCLHIDFKSHKPRCISLLYLHKKFISPEMLQHWWKSFYYEIYRRSHFCWFLCAHFKNNNNNRTIYLSCWNCTCLWHLALPDINLIIICGVWFRCTCNMYSESNKFEFVFQYLLFFIISLFLCIINWHIWRVTDI